MTRYTKHAFVICAVVPIAWSSAGGSSLVSNVGDTSRAIASQSDALSSAHAQASSELFKTSTLGWQLASTDEQKPREPTSRSRSNNLPGASTGGDPAAPSPASKQAQDTKPDVHTGATPLSPNTPGADSQTSGQAAGAIINSKAKTSAAPLSFETPVVDSPKWKEEQRISEEQERRIQRVIEGICRGC